LKIIIVIILSFVMDIAICQVQTPTQIAKASFPSVVLITITDDKGQLISLGSGFFIRDNIVVTNIHVIEGGKKGYLKLIGQTPVYEIDGIIGIDTIHDLVLLSVKSVKCPSLIIGDSNKIEVGDEVYAIGNPLGLEGTFSEGIIGGIRKIDDYTLIQISAPISHGSSGGPILNSTGKVIGVAVSTFIEGQNLNFAIPSIYVTTLLDHIIPLLQLSNNITNKEFTMTLPADKGTFSDTIVIAGEATAGTKVNIIVNYVVYAMFKIKGVLYKNTVVANDKGVWSTDAIKTAAPLIGGPSDELTIIVDQLDANGKIVKTITNTVAYKQ